MQKVDYIDGDTRITATNLNDIQSAIFELEKLCVQTVSQINASTTATVTIPNSFRGLCLICRNNESMGLYGIYANSSGVIKIAEFSSSSTITVTAEAANTLSIANSGTIALFPIVIGTGTIS